MAAHTCLGLAGDDGNSWTLVQRAEGHNVFVKTFKHTLEGCSELAEYIKTRFTHPRIVVTSGRQHRLSLMKFLGCIPDAEIIFLSPIGYRYYQIRASDAVISISGRENYKAHLLAHLAEHMI